MDYYLLTDLAATMGYHLAMSGAETFRVEDTIHRILRAYGVECEAFAIPNCVSVSLEAANGKPVLVAYWFKHDRQRIMEHLSKQKIPVRDIKSSTDIKDWNAGKIPVALIHPASAGHGLNIQQGGHILIWFGLTWSLELYQQTNARLWRQGQTDVVTIHHIITKDTVDEDVMAALEQKDMTQEKLISAVKAQLGR